jgi:DnaJ-class molecular chaperone
MPFRADPTKEYYAILGLKEGASPEEIRKAYRKLALHYHPDRNRGDAGAEERFKAISEAYAVLIDTDKRQMYDLSRGAGVGATIGGRGEPRAYSSQEDILRDLLHNREAAAIFEELMREFQRMGFRFDDGFVRHMFFGGRGVVVGGIFFGGPFSWGRGGGREYPGGFRRRIEPWGPWRQTDAASDRGSMEHRGEGRPGVLMGMGRALQGIASGLGRIARLALGGGERSQDLTQDFLITREEARAGVKKLLRFTRGGEGEEILVTIPAHVRPGTRLRLRGKGLKGKTGVRGDLYLRVQVTE